MQANALKSLTLSIGIAAMASTLSAGTPITYTDGDRSLFRFEAPDFWSVRTGGLRDLAEPDSEAVRDVSRVMGLRPEGHDGVWVGFVSPYGVSTLDGAVDYLREIGAFLVTDPVAEPAQARRIGGLSARTIKGTGNRNGAPVSFTAVVIDLPNGRVAVSVVIFEAGADTEIANDINEMFATFKAVR